MAHRLRTAGPPPDLGPHQAHHSHRTPRDPGPRRL